MCKFSKHRIAVISAVALLCCQAVAEVQPVVYPAKGQSAQKQQDQSACASWIDDFAIA